MGLQDKKRKQDDLIDSASHNVENYLRQKSGKINRYVSSGHKYLILIIMAVLTFAPMILSMYLYHQNILTIQPSKIKQYHHTIVAPHLEEEMKNELYRYIKEKIRKKEQSNQ
jgi:hypothetical protein